MSPEEARRQIFAGMIRLSKFTGWTYTDLRNMGVSDYLLAHSVATELIERETQ